MARHSSVCCCLILNCFRSDDIRKQMKSKYQSDPNYTFDKVNRASLACGPLVKWAIAQVTNRFSLLLKIDRRFCKMLDVHLHGCSLSD